MDNETTRLQKQVRELEQAIANLAADNAFLFGVLEDVHTSMGGDSPAELRGRVRDIVTFGYGRTTSPRGQDRPNITAS